jgi:hypothetical protein
MAKREKNRAEKAPFTTQSIIFSVRHRFFVGKRGAYLLTDQSSISTEKLFFYCSSLSVLPHWLLDHYGQDWEILPPIAP